jgi:Ca2+-binding RTX toxin-like protein
MGGTQNDRAFGGLGDDVLNADDNLDTNGGLNSQPDVPAFADRDFAFGGGGRDVLIANTGGDRLFDWHGEYNSFLVPFAAFGNPTIERAAPPHVRNFLIALGIESGSDRTLTEPAGELGLSAEGDKGGPRDPQPGNVPGVQRDTFGGPEDDSNPNAVSTTSPGTATYAGDVAGSSGKSLYVFGTTGNDVIDVRASATKAGYIDVVLNSKVVMSVNNVYRLYIWGNDGADQITIQTSAGAIPALVYGEGGNDAIKAGSGSALLDGGIGADTLSAGAARSILIGGDGSDALNGGVADDLLIGGTLYSSESFDAASALMTEWSSQDLAYSRRVSDLKTGTGSASGYVISSLTVRDDGARDSLLGAGGTDWFVASGLDTTDRKTNGANAEVLN